MQSVFVNEGGQVFRFLVVGSTSVFTYYTLLYGLTEFAGVWYITSAIIAFVGYYIVNFTSQKFWTFRNKNKKALSIARSSGTR